MTTKNDIERVLWKACDTFRGKIDSSRYKDYILSMLFVKYLSDVSKERREKYMEQYEGDERRVERAMSRERFHIDSESTFDFLYSNRNDPEIGQKINVALNHIENHNSGKLQNVFRAIDFNSRVDFGEVKEKNAILRNLLEDFDDLDLRPGQLDSSDIIGDAYEYMIANFASDAGKKGGEFFTPPQVSELVARLVEPRENDGRPAAESLQKSAERQGCRLRSGTQRPDMGALHHEYVSARRGRRAHMARRHACQSTEY